VRRDACVVKVVRMNCCYALGPLSEHITRMLDMVGRQTMSACAGQRTSGEASGWVWWSSSRTDWNHDHGCSHGDGASQPEQQGSTVQLLNIISSPVPLSACGARLSRRSSTSSSPRRSWARPALRPTQRLHVAEDASSVRSSRHRVERRCHASGAHRSSLRPRHHHYRPAGRRSGRRAAQNAARSHAPRRAATVTT